MQLQERPSALLDAAPRSRRDPRYALLDDMDYRDRRRSIGVGIVLTVCVWALCFFLFNLLIIRISEHHASASTATKPKPKFDIQLEDDSVLLPPPPPPPPQNFVETNPDAPENIPDKTNNFAAQNQQAAQEKPDPAGKNDRAATEGKEDWQSNQIVDGQLRQPQFELPPPPPPMPEVQETPADEQTPPSQREQVPLTGDHKIQGDSETGVGMKEIKLPENTTAKPNPDIDQFVKGMPDAMDDNGLLRSATPQIDPRRPMPRPRLEKNVRPAILADNKNGTANIGVAGFDAHWSKFGVYQQKLIETVQIQWEDLLERSKTHPPSGSKATVKFRLNSKGEISEIIDADGNGGTQFTSICTSAITDRAPYGPWSDDMLAILGDSWVLTFTFYYGRP